MLCVRITEKHKIVCRKPSPYYIVMIRDCEERVEGGNLTMGPFRRDGTRVKGKYN